MGLIDTSARPDPTLAARSSPVKEPRDRKADRWRRRGEGKENAEVARSQHMAEMRAHFEEVLLLAASG